MDQRTLVTAIETAFKDVALPSDPEEKTIPNLVEARYILDHIFRFSDQVRKFYLPKLLRFSLAGELDAANRSEWIRMLITLLNVDRGEHTPGIDRLLKEAQEQAFSSYTEEQAKAILAWLEFLKSNHSNLLFDDELQSAIRYWSGKTH
jgi:hypothetical protein